MKPERLSAMRAAHPLYGTWLSVGSPVIAELAAESGFGWLLFDLEHGCGSEASLFGNLQAIKGTRASGIVRVGAPHPDLILRALDWGADGIMAPHISSAAEAEACVQAMHYPPRGRRGVSRTVRAYAYGLHPVPPSGKLSDPVLMAQIETMKGVEYAAEIAAVDGVDVLFVGPGDLNFDIRARNGKEDYSYESCLKRVVAAARGASKQAGILARDLTELPRLVKMGFTHIAVDSDLAILRSGYLQILTRVAGRAKAPKPRPR